MATQPNKPFDIDGFYSLVVTEQGSDRLHTIDDRAQSVYRQINRHPNQAADLLPVFHELDVEIKGMLEDVGAPDKGKQYMLEPLPSTKEAIPLLLGRVVPYYLSPEDPISRHDTRRFTVSKMLQSNRGFREVFDVLLDCDDNIGWFYPNSSTAISVVKVNGSAEDWSSNNLPAMDYNPDLNELFVHYGLAYEGHFRHVADLGNTMEAFEIGKRIAQFAGGTAVDIGARTIQRRD